MTTTPAPAAANVLSLHIEPRREPITGWVQLAGAQPRAFSGWLELMTVLHEVRAQLDASPAHAPARQA